MQKKHLLLAATATALAVTSGYSQTTVPPYQKAYLEAGNIRSSVNTLGSMWYDPSNLQPECEYPKGSGKHVGYASGLWLGGYDAQGNLKTAAVTYNTQGKQDYFSGTLDPNGYCSAVRSEIWRRVWNIRRTTIDSFRAVVASVGTSNATALEAALTDSQFDDLKAWPAKGSVTIKGNNNQPLTLPAVSTREYAPFVDVDGDGAYNYLAGDYPKIKGDQMLWTAFNDMAGTKTQSGTSGIGLEIHLSAYAYARGTTADNIQFYEYTVHNYGTLTMDSTYIAFWSDMDLGYALDDYIGFDSVRRLGYVYNGKTVDGTGASDHYGANPPISGVVLLKTVGDINTNRLPTGAFTYFTNGAGNASPVITDPQNGVEFYRYMSGSNKGGQPFTNDYPGACNMTTTGYGSGPATTTVWTGNPSVRPSWSECCSGNPPGDRRFILSSAPFRMAAGSVKEVAFALVVSPGAGGCPNTNISGLQQTADTAYSLYDNPPTPTAVNATPVFAGVVLSPNPATASLTVQHLPSAATTVQVLDVTGRRIVLPTQRRGNDVILQTATLVPGVYVLQMSSGEAVETRRFVKE